MIDPLKRAKEENYQREIAENVAKLFSVVGNTVEVVSLLFGW